MVAGQKPEKSFKAGPVTASVWKQAGPKGDFYTVSVVRAYKDKEDKWQHTNSFRTNDLPRVAMVVQKAYEFLVLNEKSFDKEEIVM